jgi:hypothetical protein
MKTRWFRRQPHPLHRSSYRPSGPVLIAHEQQEDDRELEGDWSRNEVRRGGALKGKVDQITCFF